MGRRDRRHGTGAFLRWFPVVLVLALLASAGAAYRYDLGERWFGTGPDPATEPAAVAPPEGVELPALSAPPPVVPPGEATGASPRKVRRAMAGVLGDDDLGPHLVAAVGDLAGSGLLARKGRGTAMPASTMKLLTATAVLEALGPDHTFSTTVMGGGRRIVLVGGGDPFLASSVRKDVWPARADVVTLARATARALTEQGRTKVALSYDTDLFSGPAVNPRWPATYIPDVVAPIAALWVDEGVAPSGYGFVADPAAAAADAFAAALTKAGIQVSGSPTAKSAGRNMSELARVTSAPVSQIVEKVLDVSDNEGAEVLARHVGLATSGVGSNRAASRAVVDVLTELGVDMTGAEVYDGSGLSRYDRLTATTLLDVLRLAAADERPELRAVLTGLPVAGFSGSLESRFEADAMPARGVVRAKTGTLSGVSALAGVAVDRDGLPLAFVLMADQIDLADTLDARAALDEIAAALAGCRCGT